MSRYSNHGDVLKTLVKAVELVRAPGAPSPNRSSVASADRSRPGRATGRAAVHAVSIVAAYREGSTLADLVAQHDASASTIKRILREHGVRKHRLRAGGA